jgi:hypothetical protein
LPDIFRFSQPSLENPAPSGLLYKPQRQPYALRITTTVTGLSTTSGATFNIVWNNAPVCIAQRVNSATATYITATTTSSFNVICRGFEDYKPPYP